MELIISIILLIFITYYMFKVWSTDKILLQIKYLLWIIVLILVYKR
ncbi:hypothetical protein [Clostridium butyricum]|nr:hypothetical protein [Clostridium butyricum]